MSELESKFEAMFTLAGIRVSKMYETKNAYDPDRKDPWFLAKTSKGLIRIGYRKRVLAIDWSDTGILFMVTEDDVTKDLYCVHAWTDLKAVEYLKVLGTQINKE